VGLPRESMTWRAWMNSMLMLMFRSLWLRL
jgi:hypothetical protein